MATEQFDYIIVGAGSAGCVLANRLTEDPAVRVLVLEYGGSDRSVIIQMPSAFSMPMNTSKYNWRYQTAPEAHLNGRQLHCPRGKVLGGSSSINGLVYIRGHACDFDEWEELGARGWGYRNCLPYFRRAETYKFGGDEYRGQPDRCARTTATTWRIRYTAPGSRQAQRPDTSRQKTVMAICRKVLAQCI